MEKNKMKSQELITFPNLKSNILNSIKESCMEQDDLISKIADKIRQMQTVTVEPGVEIVQGLSEIIDGTVKEAVRLGCNFSVIVRGTLIGAFRSSGSIRSEAHKTIRLLVEEIAQAVFKYNGDLQQMIDGLLSAGVIVAKEQKLNVQEILLIIVEDLVSCAEEIDPGFAKMVISKIPEEYEGLKIIRKRP